MIVADRPMSTAANDSNTSTDQEASINGLKIALWKPPFLKTILFVLLADAARRRVYAGSIYIPLRDYLPRIKARLSSSVGPIGHTHPVGYPSLETIRPFIDLKRCNISGNEPSVFIPEGILPGRRKVGAAHLD